MKRNIALAIATAARNEVRTKVESAAEGNAQKANRWQLKKVFYLLTIYFNNEIDYD